MRILFTSLFLCCVSVCGFSQEEFVEPASQELTRVPFTQFTGGVVLFKALLENYKDSLTFILDTGSGGISLDSNTVVALGLQASEPERIIRGIGGTRKVGFVKNKKLTINGLIVDSLDFHIIDYGVLSALYGERIDGIAGYSLLSRYIVKINYETRELAFWTNGTLKYPKGGYVLRPRISKLPYLPAQIKDATRHRLNYLFDIGAGLTVLFSDDYIRDSAFLKKKRKKYLKQGEGLGGKVDFYLSVMKELKIGPYRFRNIPINVFDDEFNVTSYPSSGGIVGNDIFRRFNCIFNYRNSEVYIKPNKFFTEPFDYAYSGLELYLIDGRALIGDIPRDSPADKAGIKAGDEVLAVNKKFGMTLNDLKQALQSTYGPVDVLIKREDSIVTKKMKVINILSGKAISNQTLSSEFRDGIKLYNSYSPDSPVRSRFSNF